jgi:hypothetical protein
MSVDTLDRRIKELINEETGEPYEGFADLYKKEAPYGQASLRRMMWESARSGNPGVQIFLAKQPESKGGLGMRDRFDHEISGPNKGPVPTVDWSKMSVETLRELQLALNADDSD